MSEATIISNAFGENANLYTVVLDLPNTTPTPSQLRKAYYKRALLYHPDKQRQKSSTEQEDAKLKFQAISLAYSILSNDEKRKEYDDSGELNDNDYDDEFGDNNNTSKAGTDMWKDFFASTFGKVTTNDIDQFTQSYKCSEEEEKDVLKYYTMFQGNLDKMLECVMCSDEIDKKRWVEDYIKPAILNKTVEDYSDKIEKTLGCKSSAKSKKIASKKTKKKTTGKKRKINNSSKQNKVMEDENDLNDNEEEEDDESDDEAIAVEVLIDDDDNEGDNTETEDDSDVSCSDKKASLLGSNKRKKKKKRHDDGPSDDLIAAIRGNALARRQGEASFGSFMDSLEERYSSASKSKKNKKRNSKKTTEPDIPDDEFSRIQARLIKNKNNNK